MPRAIAQLLSRTLGRPLVPRTLGPVGEPAGSPDGHHAALEGRRVLLPRCRDVPDEEHLGAPHVDDRLSKTGFAPGGVPEAEPDGDELARTRGLGELHGPLLTGGEHGCARPVSREHTLEAPVDDGRRLDEDLSFRGQVAHGDHLHGVRLIIVLDGYAGSRPAGAHGADPDGAYDVSVAQDHVLREGGGGEKGDEDGDEESEHGYAPLAEA